MAPTTHRSLLALAERQHGVVARAQLRGLGAGAVRHSIESGRLHVVLRGVYAVGRPSLTRRGWWMAATLACGQGAALSHRSAGALWGIGREVGPIEVTTPVASPRRRPGLIVHRRPHLGDRDLTTQQNIPLTAPVRTLLDLATVLRAPALERAVNEADRLDLIDPERLRTALDDHRGEPGVAILRALLDRRTFALTDSELERRFLALVRRAGLPLPRTRERVNGYRVDFHWPELGLVVETDGLRYHRTATQQLRDRRRDQAHAAAGLTPLRFTHAQVRYEPDDVLGTLTCVALRLGAVG